MPNEEAVAAVVRLRPRVSSSPALSISCEPKSVCISRAGATEQRSYSFTAVYGPATEHESLYSEQLSQLVTQPFQGVNATVFAYGHTGAGKTHTMLGTAADPGMIPRSVNALLSMAAFHTAQRSTVQVTMSYLEVYNEKIFDLLAPKSAKHVDLPIRQDREYNISVPGLSEVALPSFESFTSVFGPASDKRATASTKLNNESSRSHAVLILKVKHQKQSGHLLTGKLHLIDLAGSENAKRAGNSGDRLKESGAINTSLFALSQVVNALTSSKGSGHIPYRDSKLTRLLQDSLGGSARSLVIANIAPEECHLVDTLSTLQFATKSMQIVNKPVVAEKQVSGQSGISTSSSAGESISGPTVAPNPGVLPSPFVRHTKALLSNELRSMNDALREEVLRDQKQMINIIDRLTAKVTQLSSQQGTGSSSSSATASGLVRRPLHATLTPGITHDVLAENLDFDDWQSTADAAVLEQDALRQPCASNPAPVTGRALSRTYVVDRCRPAAAVPFSMLAEPSEAAASPLLPQYDAMPPRSVAASTSAQSTESSTPAHQVATVATSKERKSTAVEPKVPAQAHNPPRVPAADKAWLAEKEKKPVQVTKRATASSSLSSSSTTAVTSRGHSSGRGKRSSPTSSSSLSTGTDLPPKLQPRPTIASTRTSRSPKDTASNTTNKDSSCLNPTKNSSSSSVCTSTVTVSASQTAATSRKPKRPAAAVAASEPAKQPLPTAVGVNSSDETATAGVAAAKKKRTTISGSSANGDSSCLSVVDAKLLAVPESSADLQQTGSMDDSKTKPTTSRARRRRSVAITTTAKSSTSALADVQDDTNDFTDPARARRTRKRRSVAPAEAVVWENDVEAAVQQTLDTSSALSVSVADADDDQHDTSVSQPQKKRKRLISRKAVRQNVLDESPFPPGRTTRRPLSDSNQPVPNDRPPAKSGSLPSKTKDVSSSAARLDSENTANGDSIYQSDTTKSDKRRTLSTPSSSTNVIFIPETPELLPCVKSDQLSTPDQVAGVTPPERKRSQTDDDKRKGALPWTDEENQALLEAQTLYPSGQRFIPVKTPGGLVKKVGRNILIAEYLYTKTGHQRTTRQISQRWSALAPRKEKDPAEAPQSVTELKARINFLEKIAKEAEQVFKSRIHELVKEYSTTLASSSPSSAVCN